MTDNQKLIMELVNSCADYYTSTLFLDTKELRVSNAIMALYEKLQSLENKS